MRKLPPRRSRLSQGSVCGVQVATQQEGAPTVILAHTVQGLGAAGSDFEARNGDASIKRMSEGRAAPFRETASCPSRQANLAEGGALYTTIPGRQRGGRYLRMSRSAIGGTLQKAQWSSPGAHAARGQALRRVGREAAVAPRRRRWCSRLAAQLLRTRRSGRKRRADHPRRGRYSAWTRVREYRSTRRAGQAYEDVDANMVLSYSEATTRQILEEKGITRRARWVVHRAGTSYSTHSSPMIPSTSSTRCFGYQRVGRPGCGRSATARVAALPDRRHRPERTNRSTGGDFAQTATSSLLYTAVPQ